MEGAWQPRSSLAIPWTALIPRAFAAAGVPRVRCLWRCALLGVRGDRAFV